MKIVRYATLDGHTAYAALHPDGSTTAVEADSSVGPFRDMGAPVTVGPKLAPLEPRAIIGIGLNYRRHAEESGAKIPEYPVVFYKNPASVIGPDAAIELPRALRADAVDYEAELAVIIGPGPAKNLTPANALAAVAGYTAANDVSAREWQREPGRSGTQWSRAKSFDTFCPLGPVLVTADEIPDPNALRIQARVSGETLQDWRTDDMIFTVAELVAFLSGSSTLLPGTVILTGTPHGVGMARTPPRWLRPGDEVEIELEGVGVLCNPVIEEPV
jgi:2-keto-4-pentenoate hydratase/2-oxohepta-3-ene-1,7-dioic acid hydratase in catechol pathway